MSAARLLENVANGRARAVRCNILAVQTRDQTPKYPQ
jgi:hypothetical protein